jgi:hypothetical protein
LLLQYKAVEKSIVQKAVVAKTLRRCAKWLADITLSRTHEAFSLLKRQPGNKHIGAPEDTDLEGTFIGHVFRYLCFSLYSGSPSLDVIQIMSQFEDSITGKNESVLVLLRNMKICFCCCVFVVDP